MSLLCLFRHNFPSCSWWKSPWSIYLWWSLSSMPSWRGILLSITVARFLLHSSIFSSISLSVSLSFVNASLDIWLFVWLSSLRIIPLRRRRRRRWGWFRPWRWRRRRTRRPRRWWGRRMRWWRRWFRARWRWTWWALCSTFGLLLFAKKLYQSLIISIAQMLLTVAYLFILYDEGDDAEESFLLK